MASLIRCATASVTAPFKGTRPFFSLPELSQMNPFSSGSGQDRQTYHERKILPYTQKQLYDLVTDVGAYNRFMPFCVGSRVLSGPTPRLASSVMDMEAELEVGFLAFKERYVSQVTCTPYEMVEAVASSSTPLFKSLKNVWRFQPASSCSPHPTSIPPNPETADLISRPTPTAQSPPISHPGPTLLSIDLAYEFSNPLHAQVSAAFFGQVSKMMVTAFEKRCVEAYGRGKR